MMNSVVKLEEGGKKKAGDTESPLPFKTTTQNLASKSMDGLRLSNVGEQH